MSTATMNVSLPRPLKKFVDKQVKCGGYSGASDYVRALILAQARKTAVADLREAILEGYHSKPKIPVNETYWAERRKRLLA